MSRFVDIRNLQTCFFIPKATSTAFSVIDEKIKLQLSNDASLTQLPRSKWTLHEWLHFINNVPLDIKVERFITLDNTFDLTDRKSLKLLTRGLSFGLSGYV